MHVSHIAVFPGYFQLFNVREQKSENGLGTTLLYKYMKAISDVIQLHFMGSEYALIATQLFLVHHS